MGVRSDEVWECDTCGKVVVVEGGIITTVDGSGNMPVNWIRRRWHEPTGDGPYTSLAGHMEERTFCSDACELGWLEGICST